MKGKKRPIEQTLISIENEDSSMSEAVTLDNSPHKPVKYQLSLWTFTMPMEILSPSKLSEHLKGFCKKFTFQGEMSKKTGYKHWQGHISLSGHALYFNQVKQLFPAQTHLEATKDYFASERYCRKEETRIEGPYDQHSIFIKTISQDQLYPWQKEAEDIHLSEPDDRSIYWYYNGNGCNGKTKFIKYLAVKYGQQITFLSSGKSNDMAHIIAKNKNAKTIMIFLPRTIEEKVNYGMIEQIKDGLVMCGKYDSEAIIFNCPHVMIFANFYPDINALSLDRWKITLIPDNAPQE